MPLVARMKPRRVCAPWRNPGRVPDPGFRLRSIRATIIHKKPLGGNRHDQPPHLQRAACRRGRSPQKRVEPVSDSKDRLLHRRGAGAFPLRHRRRRRCAAEARHGHPSRQCPIRLAASLEALSLRGVVERRTRRRRRQARRQRVPRRSNHRRAGAPRRAADAPLAPDSHQRGSIRRISPHRLQQPQQCHRPSHQE